MRKNILIILLFLSFMGANVLAENETAPVSPTIQEDEVAPEEEIPVNEQIEQQIRSIPNFMIDTVGIKATEPRMAQSTPVQEEEEEDAIEQLKQQIDSIQSLIDEIMELFETLEQNATNIEIDAKGNSIYIFTKDDYIKLLQVPSPEPQSGAEAPETDKLKGLVTLLQAKTGRLFNRVNHLLSSLRSRYPFKVDYNSCFGMKCSREINVALDCLSDTTFIDDFLTPLEIDFNYLLEKISGRDLSGTK